MLLFPSLLAMLFLPRLARSLLLLLLQLLLHHGIRVLSRHASSSGHGSHGGRINGANSLARSWACGSSVHRSHVLNVCSSHLRGTSESATAIFIARCLTLIAGGTCSEHLTASAHGGQSLSLRLHVLLLLLLMSVLLLLLPASLLLAAALFSRRTRLLSGIRVLSGCTSSSGYRGHCGGVDGSRLSNHCSHVLSVCGRHLRGTCGSTSLSGLLLLLLVFLLLLVSVPFLVYAMLWLLAIVLLFRRFRLLTGIQILSSHCSHGLNVSCLLLLLLLHVIIFFLFLAVLWLPAIALFFMRNRLLTAIWVCTRLHTCCRRHRGRVSGTSLSDHSNSGTRVIGSPATGNRSSSSDVPQIHPVGYLRSGRKLEVRTVVLLCQRLRDRRSARTGCLIRKRNRQSRTSQSLRK